VVFIFSIVVALVGPTTAALSGDFVEPHVFKSSNGALDLLMIAKPMAVPSISFTPPSGSVIHPTGWVYEVCLRTTASGNQCPAGSKTASPYGGVRLALRGGDTLKIRLVNRLPKLDPDKLTHSGDAGGANLWRNPTNLHTHGLRVPARAPTHADPTFGDYIFVQIYNSTNGIPEPQASHGHGSFVKDTTHPPAHFGFTRTCTGLRSISSRPASQGIISVGEAGDYAHDEASKAPFPDKFVRHLILKDMQVLTAGNIQFHKGSMTVTKSVVNGEVLNQEDPARVPLRDSLFGWSGIPGH